MLTVGAVATVILASAVSAQGPLELRSDDWTRRAAAFAEIARDPDALKNDPLLKSAIIELLERETTETMQAFREGIGSSRKFGEGYSKYYAHVLGNVLGLTQPQDVRALRALAFGSYNPDSDFARELASFGEPVVQPFVELTASDLAPARWNGLEGLGHVLELDAAQKTRVRLSPSSREKALAAIRSALHAADPTVRISAVRAAGAARDRASVPILQMLAQSDLHEMPGSTDRFPIRLAAQAALRAIQGRK